MQMPLELPDSDTASADDESFTGSADSADSNTSSFSSGSYSDDYSDGSDSFDSECEKLLAELPNARIHCPLPVEQYPKHMPVARSSAVSVDSPFTDPAMLKNIRADLEKVGRVILEKDQGRKFLERAQVISSINWLATSVPACVLDHLGREIAHDKDDGNSENDETPEPKMNCIPSKQTRRVSFCGGLENGTKLARPRSRIPHVTTFDGTLLFVDISGFTRLSIVLENPESLSKAINSYFQLIIDAIFEFGGDIQKFDGDAVFAEWRTSPTLTIEHCVEASAACCVAMIKACSDFPVFADTKSDNEPVPISFLNIHCGVGVGDLVGLHVGDNVHRRDYLYLGDPLKQATVACDVAELGEAVASPQFRDSLSRIGMVEIDSNKNEDESTPFVIANRDSVFVRAAQKNKWNTDLRKVTARGMTRHVDGLPVSDLIEYRRLMSLYVHPVAVLNDVAASKNFQAPTNQLPENRVNDAEIRSVYVMFINPLIELRLSKEDTDSSKERAELINDIVAVVSREIGDHLGHLDQCIVDDKGLVIIASFGLRGSTFPDMVTERALPATLAISQTLQVELGVQSKIGATFGELYCGIVGSDSRQEYSFLGPSCNLAARLMSSKDNPGVLVDENIRNISAKSFCFNALNPVRAKGYEDPVSIFEPLTTREYSWGRIEANFVGRKSEIRTMKEIAGRMIHDQEKPSKLAIMSGSSGMGKSTLLAHSIGHIRRYFGVKRGLVISKHVVQECETLVPYATIRIVMLELLDSFGSLNDETLASLSEAYSFTNDSSSGESASSFPLIPEHSASVDIFHNLCSELKPSKQVVEYLLSILFGSACDPIRSQAPPDCIISSYIAEIFGKCSEKHKLVLVAIDDIHRMDEMSWLALQAIVTKTKTVLVIGSHHSAVDISKRIKKDNWAELYRMRMRESAFVKIDVGRLSKEEIAAMIMKTIGLLRSDVSPTFLNEVFALSGGIPQFANTILGVLKMKNECSQSFQTTDLTDSSIAEILLFRVDSFDVSTRNTLNVVSLLNGCFTVGMCLRVILYGKSGEEAAKQRPSAVESMQKLLHEGILLVAGTECTTQQPPLLDHNCTQLVFSQDSWRVTVLSLMLKSRKTELQGHIDDLLGSDQVVEDHRKCAETLHMTCSALGKV